MAPYTSIVVPVYNDERDIRECIESLLNLNYPRDEFEIIVVDNNSTDSTSNITKEYVPRVKYILELKSGSYSARNSGIRESKGDLIAFIDSDCKADKNWLINFVEHFKSDGDCRIGCIGGRVVAFKPETVVEKHSVDFLDQSVHLNERYPFIATVNACYRRKTLIEAGLFDESFKSGGDVDLSWRITDSGYKLTYEPNAVVYHKFRSSFRDLFEQFFRYGMGQVKLFKKHRKSRFKRAYSICLSEYFTLPYYLLIVLPWRMMSFWDKEDRLFYVLSPLCNIIETIAFKSGLILGSIKYRVWYI